jgi:heme/copper-type cytochrome/quinol oxidase subunit 3
MEQAAIAPPASDAHTAHGAYETSTGVTNTKLAMWIFLSSECLLFGALIATYLLYRGRSKGISPSDVYNIPFTSATSFILLMSSLTMVLALAAIQRGDYRRTKIWIIATALFGMTFIGGQLYEFTEFTRQGLTVDTNLFGSSFYLLTGLHGLHVTVGIVWLLSLWGLVSQGKLQQRHSETIEIAGLYWHFVDVVWIVIFTVVYLIPR